MLKINVDSMLCFASKGIGDYEQAYNYLLSFVKQKEKVMSENQKKQLNELIVTFEVREKDLTIANQNIELTKKMRNMQVMVLVIIIVLLLFGAQLLYILKTRKFRKELFRKEIDLHRESMEIRSWMEWRHKKHQKSGDDVAELQLQDELIKENASLPGQTLLYNELREVFENQKLYLDPELNINSVIKVLGTNQKYLYQAISENSDNNFRSFLNRYRVDEAKRIIEKKISLNEEMNLSEIYSLSGFNSAVSFYRAFRSVTRLTPKEYAIEVKNEIKRKSSLF
jgi:AraC-like DNA-binding protein